MWKKRTVEGGREVIVDVSLWFSPAFFVRSCTRTTLMAIHVTVLLRLTENWRQVTVNGGVISNLGAHEDPAFSSVMLRSVGPEVCSSHGEVPAGLRLSRVVLPGCKHEAVCFAATISRVHLFLHRFTRAQ